MPPRKKSTRKKKTTAKRAAKKTSGGRDTSGGERADAQKRFLDAYREHLNLTKAAHAAGIARRTVQVWRAQDPAFEEACQEARAEYLDGLLEVHDRMATKGLLVPLLDDDGQETGKFIKVPPSIKALHRRIEHLDPTFKQRHEVEHSGEVALSLTIVKTYEQGAEGKTPDPRPQTPDSSKP